MVLSGGTSTGQALRVGVFHPGMGRCVQTALALQRKGQLAFFATSIYYRRQHWTADLLKRLPPRLREPILRECGKRRLEGLDEERVIARPMEELLVLAAQRVVRSPVLADSLTLWRNRRFARWIADEIRRREVNVLYGWDASSLAAFVVGRELGMACVLDYPCCHWRYVIPALEREIRERPGFVRPGIQKKLQWIERVGVRADREAELSDLILVGSRFAASTLVEAGFDGRRIRVIPYCADPPARDYFERRVRNENTVMYAGDIQEAKGIYYLLEAVKRLHNPAITVQLVGHLAVPSQALRPYEGMFTHTPHVPRSELWDLYRTADIFVLPSLFEGFAKVQIEAASMGLPVICTTASGGGDRLVVDGESGFVVPPANIELLAEKIALLAEDRELRLRLGRCAWERAQDFSVDRYGERLTEVLADLPWEGQAGPIARGAAVGASGRDGAGPSGGPPERTSRGSPGR